MKNLVHQYAPALTEDRRKTNEMRVYANGKLVNTVYGLQAAMNELDKHDWPADACILNGHGEVQYGMKPKGVR